MADKITSLKNLKNLGFGDNEIVELEKLAKEFSEGDLYKKIGKKNKDILGTDIRPAKITFDNISKRMETDDKIMPKDILKEYQRDRAMIAEGKTENIDGMLEDMSAEFESYGIAVTKKELETIMNSDRSAFDDLLDVIAWFRRYINRLLDGDKWVLEEAEKQQDIADIIIGMYRNVDEETGEIE